MNDRRHYTGVLQRVFSKELRSMTEIKPGPELDKAVAEVISGAGTVHPEGTMSPALPVPFLPSTDLNAAFAAAEVAGLFDKWCLWRSSEGWELMTDVLVSSETPALAICAAILKE